MRNIFFEIKNERFSVWHIKGPEGAPVMHWAHSNGFNARTYVNMYEKLSEHFTIYAWDARKHGFTQDVSEPVLGKFYEKYSDDLVCLIETLYEKHETPIVLAGHSFGASLCIKAEKRLKNKISKVVLADPVIFTPLFRFLSLFGRFLKLKQPKGLYFFSNALKRRAQWSNYDEILSSYSNREFFREWDLNSLKNYLKYGTKNNSQGIELACSPQIESRIFLESEQEFLSRDILNMETETFVYLANRGSPAFAKKYFGNNDNVKTVKIIKNSTHFFPVERHKLFTSEIVKDLLNLDI